MSRTSISKAVRQKIEAEARWRCGYCQTQQAVVGAPLQIEHIIPEAAHGSSEPDNLWLACAVCNNHKGTQTQAIDPFSRELTPLFNPRTQIWSEHFVWNAAATEIVGLTPIGRTTVFALKMNQPFMIRARRRWVSVGWHPPKD